jgi:dCTP deaminase
MILSNEGIKAALADGSIGLDPRPTEDRIETSSVDLLLSDKFSMWKKDNFEPEAKGAKVTLDLYKMDYISVSRGYLVPAPTDADGCLEIPPFREHPWHYLAQTREKITLSHKVAARVEGRSSFARVGLIVHFTAPIIQAGFDATITLEMANFGPFYLRLVPLKTKICQVVFEMLDQPASGQIKTKFQHQTEPGGTHPA